MIQNLEAGTNAFPTRRCLSAGAEDYIVKPLQSKDVQRLRNCSLPKPKGSPPCDTVAKRKPLPAPDHAAVAVASSSGRKAHFAGVAMARSWLPQTCSVTDSLHNNAMLIGFFLFLLFLFQGLHSSSVELSHYFPLLFKLVLLMYAVLFLGEVLHRWSSRGGVLPLWCA
jgi:two-component response regulator ARR-A family